MLTKKEFEILVLLTEEQEALSQREIAKKLGHSLGTINKLINGLAEKHYVSDGSITGEGANALEPYRVKRDRDRPRLSRRAVRSAPV